MDFNEFIGWSLRIGVVTSAVLIIAGFLIAAVFQPAELTRVSNSSSAINSASSRFGDIAASAASGNGISIVMLGFILLIATPVFRVFASIFWFASNRNVLYVAITAIVFIDLMIAIFIVPHILG